MSSWLCFSRLNGYYLFHQKNMFPLSFIECAAITLSQCWSRRKKKYVNLWLGQSALCHGMWLGHYVKGHLLVISNVENGFEERGSASECDRWGGASSNRQLGLEQQQAKLSKKSSSSTFFFFNLSQVFALRHHCKHQLLLDRDSTDQE